jgi:hypothetical protein
MLATLFPIIAPVFVCAAIGWAWGRLGRAYDFTFVATLLTNVGAPCLVFHTLANLTVGAATMATMAAAAVGAVAACALAGAVVLRLAGEPVRALLPSVMFGNTGNIGLPLCLLAFGDEGLSLAIGVFVVHSIGMFTLGVALASGERSFAVLARVPLLYAVALAVVFVLSGTRPPAWLDNTTRLLAGMTIPMMLITLGVSLARLGVRRLRTSALIAVLRLGLGFVVALGLIELLDLEGAARGVLIVQLSMPVAVFNYLFAQRYHSAPETVAGAVVLSTAVAFVLLPVLLWFAMDTGR